VSIIKWLDKNLEYICLAVLLIVMTVLSFTNVVLRYCFQSALSWSDEVCCYCLALSAFASLPCSIRYRTAIRVDTLVTVLPQRVKKILSLVCDVIMVVFLGVCIKGGVDVALNSASINQKSPALQIPVVWLYGVMTFFFALSILRTVEVVIKDLKGKQEES
jgi:TRAP-type C4-dicarboxylate transport system permease small subunit